MRYSMSPRFARVQRSHAIAYTTQDAFASAGEDETICGRAASDAEYTALDAMMLEPAQSAGDVLAKLKVFLDREMYNWDGPRAPDAAATYRALLERDLTLLLRPVVSTEMAQAFEAWAAAWQALHDAEYDEEGENAGNLPIATTHAEAAAWGELMAVPSATPGDFIAKTYVDILQDIGGWTDGFPFQIKSEFDQSEGVQNGSAFLYDDIRNCDLGRCIMALGRVEFDAKAWIEATITVGGDFKLMVDLSADHARTLWQKADCNSARKCDRERHRMLQELIGGQFHVERFKAVCDLIDQEYPEHRMTANQRHAREEGVLGGDAPPVDGTPVPAGNGTAVAVEE
jgi:hypothetical protein